MKTLIDKFLVHALNPDLYLDIKMLKEKFYFVLLQKFRENH